MDRLSFLDTQFLHLEDASSPMHIAGLCVFAGPPPTRDEFRRALNAKMQLIPRYRKKLRFPPFELGRPVWIDDTRFDLDYHVRWTALPAPGDDAAMGALMGRLMAQTLDRDRPLWELWIVEGLEGGRWAAISKIHHSMVDGIAGVELNAVMLDAVPDAPLPEPVPWTPAPPPSPAALVLDAWRGLAEDSRALARGALAAFTNPLAGARAAAATAIGLQAMTRKLLRFTPSPLEGTIGPHRSYARATARLADVDVIRKSLGGSVNDVVLAAVTAGHRALLEHRGEEPAKAKVQALIPVSLRRPDEKHVLHNKVSAMLYELPLGVADPVVRLDTVRDGMRRLKALHMAEAGALVTDLGDLAPPMVVGAVTRGIARAMHRVPQTMLGTVVTNVPGPRQPLYCMGRQMLAWYPYVPISQGIRVGTAILSYAGTLAFGITADPDSAPDAGLVARAIESDIATLARFAAINAPTAQPPARPPAGAAAPPAPNN